MGDELMQTMQEVDSTPRLIIECMTSTLAGRRFAFTATDLKRGVLLGRASDCHVRFDASKDLKVSGHHAMIDEREGKIMVRDQGSSNGVFLNDVRVTAGGAALLSGSKLALGQEGAIMKLLVPGQSTGKTSQGMQQPPQSAAAPISPADRPLRPAPGTGAVPIAPPQAPAPKPPAPPQGEDHAKRGMPSVQTDPALLARKDASLEPAGSAGPRPPSASDRTRMVLKEEARPAAAKPRRKFGAAVTFAGAIALLMLAAGAIAVWHFMGQPR
jgi:pSer/pThr/pTyr-binding forkhead associated (FHA) protein